MWLETRLFRVCVKLARPSSSIWKGSRWFTIFGLSWDVNRPIALHLSYDMSILKDVANNNSLQA